MGRIPTHPGDALGYAIRKIEEEYAKLKWLSEKELKKKNLVKIQCPRCKEYVFLEEGKKPWIVKCSHCCDEEEKPILKWLYIINPNDEVFDECPKCQKYSFISATNEEKYIEFRCKNCDGRFFIHKRDVIPF